MATIRKPLMGIAAFAVAATLSACLPTSNNNYHGTVAGNAGVPLSTSSTPSVPAVPVTISGSGETVKTANLVAGGYTIAYQASSNCIIVTPVEADGSDGISAVSQCANGDAPVSGTTNFHATGRTTFHVYNTDGNWVLTFRPLE